MRERRSHKWRRHFLFCACAAMVIALALTVTNGPAVAHGDHPDPLAVTFTQNLNAQLPLGQRFYDEQGQVVTLADYLGEKPAILVMGYFECPTLCVNVVYPELVAAVQAMTRLQAGADFEVIAVTLDEAETTAVAARAKTKFLGDMQRRGWHFLTGDKTAIAQVADAIGFHYAYDEATAQYAHPTGIVIATPAGKVARYFFGLEYPPLDLRLSLIEAGQGMAGTAVDQLLLLCYRYDPQQGRYNNVIWTAVRFLGLGTMLALGVLVWRATRSSAND